MLQTEKNLSSRVVGTVGAYPDFEVHGKLPLRIGVQSESLGSPFSCITDIKGFKAAKGKISLYSVYRG